MTDHRTYHFRAADLDDLALLRQWQAQPHVRQWWGTGDVFDADDLADPRVSHWIVSVGGHPFGFMQDYSVHGWDEHHFGHLAPGTRGIDQFIGPPDHLDRGHGTAFIRQRMDQMFDDGAPVIATDPHPDNSRAIAVYCKLGFRIVGPRQTTRWGVVIPMEARHP